MKKPGFEMPNDLCLSLTGKGKLSKLLSYILTLSLHKKHDKGVQTEMIAKILI